MATIYTGGTFDLFHAGHVRLLKRLKQLAGPEGKVIVAINPDEFIEKFKGRKPIMSEQERYDVVSACRYVDEVRINKSGEDSKPTILLEPRPDVIAIGSDWASKDYNKQMGFTEEWLDEHGIVLIYVTYTAGISTTDLKRRVSEL
jgi:glycerol-3-phosphate cytidylyltransferase